MPIKNILIVDDSPTDRQFLSELLAKNGFKVSTAAYVTSLLCIVLACAGAALVPTLRAGRVDPINALRPD